MLENMDYQIFINLMYAEPDNYKNIDFGFKAETKGQYILAFLMYFDNYKNIILKYFKKYILNFEEDISGGVVDGVSINAAELEYIANVILVSGGYAKIEDMIETEEDKAFKAMSPMEKQLYLREKEVNEKLMRAKNKNKNADSSNITQEKIVAAVMYEFNLSFEDIKKMNYFGLSLMFGHAYQLDYHKVMQYAAGAGNLGKKAKYDH